MRSFAGLLIGCSVLVTLAGLWAISFWYGAIYDYYCPLAGQCADIFHSNDQIGLDGIILTILGVAGIFVGVTSRLKEKQPRASELESRVSKLETKKKPS